MSHGSGRSIGTKFVPPPTINEDGQNQKGYWCVHHIWVPPEIVYKMKINITKAEIMSQIEGWPKNHLSFLNFPPDFKSKQILIGQKQFFQCLHWLTAIQNKQKGGKFELDKSHLGHPSIRLNNIALVNFSFLYLTFLKEISQ